jgi:hypothetical protein
MKINLQDSFHYFRVILLPLAVPVLRRKAAVEPEPERSIAELIQIPAIHVAQPTFVTEQR